MKTRLLTALLTLCLVLSLTPISATTVFADEYRYRQERNGFEGGTE